MVESYFFNSDGFYIHIDDSVALFVDINGPRPGHMCFTAKVTGPYRKLSNVMRFRACKYSDPRTAHENAVRDFLGAPTSIPDPYVVEYPVWSTWARYKANVNASSVGGYAREIIEHGFPRGTMEIDDDWETCYGSAEFNVSRFGNIKGLTDELSESMFETRSSILLFGIYTPKTREQSCDNNRDLKWSTKYVYETDCCQQFFKYD